MGTTGTTGTTGAGGEAATVGLAMVAGGATCGELDGAGAVAGESSCAGAAASLFGAGWALAGAGAS